MSTIVYNLFILVISQKYVFNLDLLNCNYIFTLSSILNISHLIYFKNDCIAALFTYPIRI